MRKQVNTSGYFGCIAEKQKAYKPRMQLSSLAPNCCGHPLNVFAQSLPSSGIISLSPSQVSQRGLLTLAALPETVGLKMYNNKKKSGSEKNNMASSIRAYNLQHFSPCLHHKNASPHRAPSRRCYVAGAGGLGGLHLWS